MQTPATTTSNDAADSGEPRRRRSWWKRLLLWLAILLVAIVVVIGIALAVMWSRIPSNSLDPMTPGTLSISAPAATHQIGPFTVTVSPGEQGGVTVTETAGGDTVWHSPPGTPFLAAGSGEVAFQEHFGYFWADVQRSARLTDQSIAASSQRGDSVVIDGQLSGSGQQVDYSVELTPITKTPDVTVLGLHAATTGDAMDSLMLTSAVDQQEQLFGLGEAYRPLDLVGTVTPILTGEQGLGRGEQPITFIADITNWAGGTLETTYAVAPTWVTSQNRSFELADVEPSGAFGTADFSRPGQASLESWSGTLSAEMAVGEDPSDILRIRAAGQQRPGLADWVQEGAVLGLQGGTERVRGIVSDMQESGADISAVWLQDWTGKRVTDFGDRLWWTWQLDDQTYPGWKQMVDDFHKQDIKVLTYVNIMVVDSADKSGKPVTNLYRQAEARGFLVKDQSGKPYLADQNGYDAALVDLTNPRARDWYADVIAEDVLGIGVDGFMADFGEALPMDAVLHKGQPLQMHNRWPQLWSQTVQQGCERAGKPECVAFMRSAFLRNQEHVPLMWAGDQMVDYSEQDGLASAVYSMVGGGISGFPLWHSDIGGYTSLDVKVEDYVRPPQLNERWSEMQAFGVVMRTHETNRPAENAQVYDTTESRAAFARMTKVYRALQPYRKAVTDEAARTGLPAMRSGWQVFPGTAAADADLQFFLGDHLLMAPVVEENADQVSVVFPPGTWVNVFTGQEFPGDTTTTVPAPLGTPAAFVQQADPVGAQIRDSLRGAGLTTD